MVMNCMWDVGIKFKKLACALVLNPLKSELLTKQACRDELVVYSLFFSPTTYTSLYLYVLSTFLRILNFALYIYIYIYIYMYQDKEKHIDYTCIPTRLFRE